LPVYALGQNSFVIDDFAVDHAGAGATGLSGLAGSNTQLRR